MNGKYQPENARFVGALEALVARSDRGALARLRRSLTQPLGEDPQAYPYVIPWIPQQRTGWDEACFFSVGGLFALFAQAGITAPASRNLGASLAQLGESAGSDATGAASLERRFIALLNCHRADLWTHLRMGVNLLKSKGVGINWPALLADLRRWNHPRRVVQRRWAADFWRARRAVEPAATAHAENSL